MTSLSLQAQAVRDAVREICPAPADEIAAVALRAVADQVVPETTTPWNSTLTPVISAKEIGRAHV